MADNFFVDRRLDRGQCVDRYDIDIFMYRDKNHKKC